MNVHFVADVGNTRIKWGLCARVEGAPAVTSRAALADDAAAWDARLARWLEEFPLLKLAGALTW